MIVTTSSRFFILFLLAASAVRADEPIKLLPVTGGAPVVDTDSRLPFNRKQNPITEHDAALLTQRGYRFNEEGKLFAPGSQEPVLWIDFFYVVEEIRSRQRLQALLKIQLIQSRNSFSKNLPPKDRNEIRSIARDNWHLLSHRTRKDLESLFSKKEVFELKRLPEFSPLAAPTQPVEIGNLPEGVVIPTEKALHTLAGPITPLGIKAEVVKRSHYRRKKRTPLPKPKPVLTPPPAWNALTRGTVRPLPPPWEPDPSLPVKPLPAPWKKFKPAKEYIKPVAPVPPVKAMPAPWGNEAPAPAPIPAPAPVPKAVAVQPPILIPQDPLPENGFTPAERAMRATVAARQGSGYRTETAVEPPTQIARGMVPVAMPLPVPVAPLPPVSLIPLPVVRPQPKEIPVEYPEIDDATFTRFLETAPYSKEIQPLLRLIAKHVREPERRAAIGILTTSMPQIVIDSLKAGVEARSSIGRIERGASFARTLIALHDGPVLTSRKSLFSGKQIFFMPDVPSYYAARGKSMPANEAYSNKSVSVRDLKSEWGTTRMYKDGSTRLRRSNHAIAGALLNALMRIDGDFRGWADDYHSRMRAEAVEFRFYRSIKADTDDEPDLDPELAARYREWFHRPEDYLDMQLNSFFERSREEELAMLESAGVEGVGKSGPVAELQLPPSDSPAKRAWLKSDELARGKE